MLSLPQSSPNDSPHVSEPIPMDESAEVIAGLLSIAEGLEPPKALDDIDYLERILWAADKYEMPMPIALIRALLPPHISLNPVRAYGMASRMDWVPERAQAAAASCAVNVLAPENVRELGRLESPHLERLLDLHERRRCALALQLESRVTFVANVKGSRCRGASAELGCGELVDHTTWGAFKFGCLKEPWRLAAVTRSGTVQTGELPGLRELLEDKCPKCGRNNYSPLDTMHNLATIAKELPSTIEVETEVRSWANTRISLC